MWQFVRPTMHVWQNCVAGTSYGENTLTQMHIDPLPPPQSLKILTTLTLNTYGPSALLHSCYCAS